MHAGGSQADNNLGGVELGELSDRQGQKVKSSHHGLLLHGIMQKDTLTLLLTMVSATILNVHKPAGFELAWPCQDRK